MRFLSKLKEIKKVRGHKRESDVASRQMQEDARRHVESRLDALEIKLRNEARQR